MTISVDTDEKKIITDSAPIVRKFTGQPLNNLINWMKRQGGFKLVEYKLIRVGIVGSRSRNTPKDKNVIRKVLKKQIAKGYKIHVVSGGCSRGADRFAEELAKELNLGISIHKPDVKPNCERWEYAQAAYARNTLIANECNLLLAVWDGVSGGTKDTIDKAEKQNKPIIYL